MLFYILDEVLPMKYFRMLALVAVIGTASVGAGFAHDGKKDDCGDGGSCCSTKKASAKTSAKASVKKAEKKNLTKAEKS
jgi:hypothetical protein